MDRAKPKHLRKTLRRTEAKLAKASAKRDRAQARVDAMSIIVDEIRATIAESERNEAVAKTASNAPMSRTQSVR